MGIFFSWQLLVASIYFLTGFVSSTDPAPCVTSDGKPLPTKIASMEYESVCLNIYDSQISNSKKIYYYSPIALLNPLDIVSIVDKIPTQGSLSIGFSIWNEDVGNKVARLLTLALNQKVELNQVHVFPFESVRLTSKVQSPNFSLNNDWFTYNQPSLRFTLTCPTREGCDRMKTDMRVNPKKYDHLQLEFNPQFLNNETCFHDEDGISIEALSMQVKALTKSLEETKWSLMKQLTITQKELDSTRVELNNTKSIVDDLTTKLNARTSEVNYSGQMPTSCVDLKRMGHKLSGFFSVKGSKKMEMVYCDFIRNDTQQWVGYTDVKSAPVHFYVQRSAIFSTPHIPIPFYLRVLNEGNAINLTSGVFTAPRTGIYFFSFVGLVHFPVSEAAGLNFSVALYLNGNQIGFAWVEESHTVPGQDSPLALQLTLKLKKGDQVWIAIDTVSEGAYLWDDSSHYTHFTGFMLEEEIVASL